MIQRQVIVTWYTPEEKTPGENEGVIATVSGDVNGAIIFDRAIVLMCWSKEYGWYSEEYSFTHLTVHAWCDLEAYEGLEGGENMMDLESAIKHCEEVAETNERICDTEPSIGLPDIYRHKDEAKKCANEHRQLAEWLKELKAYKEQSGDAISRQAVDDAIYDYSRSCNVDYSQIMEYIEKLPSVTPQGETQQRTWRWIPVWERLPEERGVYLVTQKAIFPGHVFRRIVGYAPNLHDVDEYDFADKKRSGWYEYDSEWGYRELDDVIAWMPLPEPYKAESEDGE